MTVTAPPIASDGSTCTTVPKVCRSRRDDGRHTSVTPFVSIAMYAKCHVTVPHGWMPLMTSDVSGMESTTWIDDAGITIASPGNMAASAASCAAGSGHVSPSSKPRTRMRGTRCTGRSETQQCCALTDSASSTIVRDIFSCKKKGSGFALWTCCITYVKWQVIGDV